MTRAELRLAAARGDLVAGGQGHDGPHQAEQALGPWIDLLRGAAAAARAAARAARTLGCAALPYIRRTLRPRGDR